MLSQLKKARIESGETLEEVSNHLKIRKQYLIALEENDLKSLPGEVYVKGYLKLYSNYLHITEDSNLITDNNITEKPHILLKNKPTISHKCKNKKYLIIASILMLVVIPIIYHFISKFK